ncbi:MAG: bifunctional DNA primase/polymerase [Nitrososphaerota archaeon]|nr:bifunctional DNA primase/polymerase [Candidatus Bathyarchaeota archaeon]MDW8023634.1 bifunctional DNA primase/polymerase [Nitrososphaerota archaeon]
MEPSLKETAYNYWFQGLNIILLKEKKPLHEWKHWQNERQSLNDFEALPWGDADSFALIGGSKLESGLFFAAIDFDVKNVSEEAREKGKQALKHLPVTQIEETPSGGQHWIYYSQTRPKTISAYHNAAALELIGEGKLCIMAPSSGYRRLNDNPPTVVQNLEELFYQALNAVDVKTSFPLRQFWFNRKDLANQPYKGKNPPCMNALFKGTCEGQRNEYAIRIASFLINFRGLNPNYAFKRLKDWNRFNNPPLSQKEIENVVKSAIKGCYVFGCEDNILKQNCNAAECPIAPKTKQLTAEEREKAEKLLEDPKFLDYILEYGRKRLLGEDNVLLLNFVTLCSGQTKYPISTILSGFSGSGKNESLRAIKSLIPEEWIFEFTTSTPEAIKYIGEDFTGTLIVYEAAGVKGESGSLSLRAIGEGESIETIYPMRNELTGKMELGRAKTKARNFITTQSDLDIHPDLYRRVFKYEMNHSPALTKRVLAKRLRDAIMPESLKAFVEEKGNPTIYNEEDFKNALRLNDWKAEVILFPPSSLMRLLDLAVTKEQKVALRTHIEKILNFMRVLALINQRKRVGLKVEGKSYVIASPEDFQTALNALQTTIKETITRLGKRQQEVLGLLEESEETLDKHKVAEKLGISTDTAARALKSLAKLGYVKENVNTKPYTYQLLQKEPNYLGILENPSQYCRFWQESLEKFLDVIAATLQQRGIVFQILNFENQASFKEKFEAKAGNKESGEIFACLTHEKLSKNYTLNCRAAEVPFKADLGFPAEKSQKHLGFSDIPREKRLFLWCRISPAEKCELCGRFAVEYIVKDPVSGAVLKRCHACFEQMRHTFSCSEWRNMGEEGFASSENG